MNAETLVCVMTTPFGTPVEPDVKRICDPSLALRFWGSGVDGAVWRSPVENAILKLADSGGGAVVWALRLSSQMMVVRERRASSLINSSSRGTTRPPATITRFSQESKI